MAIRIEVPEYNTAVEFPDDTAPAEIESVLAKNYPTKAAQPQKLFSPSEPISTMGIASPHDQQAARTARTFVREDIPNVASTAGARIGAGFESAAGGLMQSLGEEPENSVYSPDAVRDIGPIHVDPRAIAARGKEMGDEGRAITDVVSQEKPLQTRPGKILGSTVESIGANLPGMAATMVTGSPALGLSMMGLQQFGQTYDESRAKGLSVEDATNNAAIQGGAEVATELLPFVQLSKFMKPGGLSTKVLRHYLADVPGEHVATAVENATGKYFDRPGMTDQQRKDAAIKYLVSGQHGQDQIDTFFTTVLQSAVMGGMAKTANAGAHVLSNPHSTVEAIRTRLEGMRTKLAAVAVPDTGITNSDVSVDDAIAAANAQVSGAGWDHANRETLLKNLGGEPDQAPATAAAPLSRGSLDVVDPRQALADPMRREIEGLQLTADPFKDYPLARPIIQPGAEAPSTGGAIVGVEGYRQKDVIPNQPILNDDQSAVQDTFLKGGPALSREALDDVLRNQSDPNLAGEIAQGRQEAEALRMSAEAGTAQQSNPIVTGPSPVTKVDAQAQPLPAPGAFSPSVVKPDVAPATKIETPLSSVQQEFIRGRVKALGSIEAVQAKYGDQAAPVDRYARDFAAQHFGMPAKVADERPVAAVAQPTQKEAPTLDTEQRKTEVAPEPARRELEQVKPSTVDTPAQGALNAARERKANLWKQITSLRQQIKDEPINGDRGGLRLKLLKAQDAHATAQRAERDAQAAIEKRANELGQTTVKPGPAAAPAPTLRPATAPPSTARAEAAARVTAASRKIDRQSDGIAVAISKLGGLDFAEAQREWGDVVKDSRKTLANHVLAKTRRFGAVFKGGGKPLDKMRESLVEHGYLPEGADLHDLYAAVEAAAGGRPGVSTENAQESDLEREAREHEERVIAGMSDEAKAVANEILDILDADDTVNAETAGSDTSFDFGFNLEGNDETRNEAQGEGTATETAAEPAGESDSTRQAQPEAETERTDDAGGWRQGVAVAGDRAVPTIGGVQRQGGERQSTGDLMDGFTPEPAGLFREEDLRYNDSRTNKAYSISSVSPIGTGTDSSRRADGVREQLAFFTPTGEPTPEARQVVALAREVKTFTKTARVITGHVRTGLTSIRSPQDLAHVMAGLRKKTVENFVVVVTDKNDKIVGIIDQTTGTVNQSLVHPSLVLGASSLIDGAENVYLVHNHPTGDPTFSPEDRSITTRIYDAGKGTGLTVKGIMAVGSRTATFFDPEWQDTTSPFNIPTAARNQSVPVEGARMFTRRPAADALRITSPSQVPGMLSEAKIKGEGVALLDGKNRLVGFVPMSSNEMFLLRSGDKNTGAGLITKTIRQTNAVAMIAVSTRRAPARNLGSYGNALGVKLLDIYNPEDGGSASEYGAPTDNGEAWFSLAKSGGPRSPFYSKLSEVVDTKMSGRMHVKQLERTLENNGVTRDEIDNVLGEFAGRESVNKAEVQEAIKANAAPLKDVVLGEGPRAAILTAKQVKDTRGLPSWATVDPESWAVYRNGEFIFVASEDATSAEEAKREYFPENDDDYDSSQDTHFAQYTEPGAVDGSYREMFVTAPKQGETRDVGMSEDALSAARDSISDDYDLEDGYYAVSRDDGYVMYRDDTLAGFNKMADSELGDIEGSALIKVVNGKVLNPEPINVPTPDWRDGHSQYDSIENPVVRIRFNERNADGKRVLFVEEMQGPSDANQQKMPDYLRKRIYDLGVKRVLAYAKENGFDGVGWTTGAMQAARYDLSKQVDRIIYKKREDGKFYVEVFKDGYNGPVQSYPGGLSVPQLEETVGKEITRKMVNTEGDEVAGGTKSLSGLDLKVGGEGLTSLYDRTLPSLFKKYGKETVSTIPLEIPKIGKQSAEAVTVEQRAELRAIVQKNDNLGYDSPGDAVSDLITGRLSADHAEWDSPEDLAMVNAILKTQTEAPVTTAPFLPVTDRTPASYPQFSLAKRAAGTDASEIRTTLTRVTADMNNAPAWQVVQSESELPETVQYKINSLNASGAVRGVFTGGRIYVVADNLNSADEAESVFLHEAVAHFGLRGLLGDRFKPVLQQIAMVYGKKGLRDIAGRYRLDLSKQEDRMTAAEEKLAEMAESGDRVGIVKRTVAMVRDWLRRHGFKVEWSDNDIKALLARAQGYVERSDAQATELFDGNHFAIAGPPGRADLPTETKVQKGWRKFQDKYNRVGHLQDFLKEQGVRLSELANASRGLYTMNGKIADQLSRFMDNEIQPLVKEAAKAKINLDDISDYLLMQHAAEANAAMVKLHNDPTRTAFGVDDAEAVTALAAYQARPDFATLKRLADRFQAFSTQTADMLQDNGIISDEMRAAWDNAYQHYVPLRGGESDTKPAGTGKGMRVNGKQQRRSGHERRDEHVIENIIKARESAIKTVEKNNVALSVAQLLHEAADDRIGTVGKPELRRVFKNKASYTVMFQGNPVAAFTSEDAADRWTGQDRARTGKPLSDYVLHISSDPTVAWQASPMLGPNEINAYVNGHQVRIQINDEVAAGALTNLGAEGLGTMLQIGKQINNYLSRAYTGYDPRFTIRNTFRDFTAGMVNLTGDYGAATAAKIAANYPKAVKEFMKARHDPTRSTWVNRYRKQGGSTGASWLSSLERLGEDVESMYQEQIGSIATYRSVYADEIAKGRSGMAARTKALGRSGVAGFHKIPVLGHFLKMIETMNAVSENAFRVATFMTLVQAGRSEAEAGEAAKNSTINFDKRGELGAQVGALWLFFNPAMQGIHRTVFALSQSEHKLQAQAIVGSMALVGFMAAELARGMGGPDDDEWDKIPRSVKNRNLVIRTGDKTQITIPLPYEYGSFVGLGYAINDMVHSKADKRTALNLAGTIIDGFSPLGNPISDEGDVQPLTMMPTVAKMALAPSTNTNSFGSRIAPEKFSESKPDSQNMWRGTKGSVYDTIASGMNEATGGTKYSAGAVDVSPEVLKYYTRTLLGGAFTFIDQVVGLGIIGANGAEPDVAEIPMVSVLTRENSVRDTRRMFWDIAKDAKTAIDEFNAARKGRDFDTAASLKEQKADLIAVAGLAAQQAKLAKAKRDAIDAVRLDENMSFTEKREKTKDLEEKESEIYDRLIKRFNQ